MSKAKATPKESAAPKETAKEATKEQAKPKKPAFDPNEDSSNTKVDERPAPAKPKKGAGTAPKKDSAEKEQEKFDNRLLSAAERNLCDFDSEQESLHSRTFPHKLSETLQHYVMSVLDSLRSMESAHPDQVLVEPLPADKFATLATKATKTKKTKPKKKEVNKSSGKTTPSVKVSLIKGKRIEVPVEEEEEEEAEEADEAEEVEEDTESKTDAKPAKTVTLRNPVSIAPEAKMALYYAFIKYLEGCKEVLAAQQDGGKSIKSPETFVKAMVLHTPDGLFFVPRSVVAIVQQNQADIESMSSGPYDDKVGAIFLESLGTKTGNYGSQANGFFRMFMQVLGRALAYELFGLASSRLQSVNLGMLVARLRDLDSRTQRYLTENVPEFKSTQDCSLYQGFYTNLVTFKSVMIPPLTAEEKEKRKNSRKSKAVKTEEAEGDEEGDEEAEGDEDEEEAPVVEVKKRGK